MEDKQKNNRIKLIYILKLRYLSLINISNKRVDLKEESIDIIARSCYEERI
jgi:hypothetical protein